VPNTAAIGEQGVRYDDTVKKSFITVYYFNSLLSWESITTWQRYGQEHKCTFFDLVNNGLLFAPPCISSQMPPPLTKKIPPFISFFTPHL